MTTGVHIPQKSVLEGPAIAQVFFARVNSREQRFKRALIRVFYV